MPSNNCDNARAFATALSADHSDADACVLLFDLRCVGVPGDAGDTICCGNCFGIDKFAGYGPVMKESACLLHVDMTDAAFPIYK